MRLRIVGMLVLGFALAGAGTAAAQVSTTGSIQMIFEDQQGGRLPGVSVSATANDVITSRTAISDAEGVAILEALAPSAHYMVKGVLSGFNEFVREEVLVRSGQVTTLHSTLALSTVSETVTVQGTITPLVDVTTATTGADITLALTESMPTGRTYQSYLQLVPGVMPDSQNSSGNPSSRSGMNWKDVTTNDNIGVSADNAYYFDAMNVTDPLTGTFGANLNTEIIQEQRVITGAIPAEYVGVAGLISTVITKTGTNEYHGSGNYFFQNQNLVADSEHVDSNKFNDRDTAFTIGGPVMRNKIWGFGSYRYLHKKQDVSSQDTHQFLREATTTQKQSFAKGTWAVTQNDLATFTFLNDPYNRDADSDPSVVNNRVRIREQGGNNYSATYNRVWGSSLLLDGAWFYHDAQLSDFAAVLDTRNTIAFQTTDVRTIADEQKGGFGENQPQTRPNKAASIAAQYQWNAHRIKGGFEFIQHEQHRDRRFTGPDTAQYTSIASKYLGPGVTATAASDGPWTQKPWRVTTAADFTRFIDKVNTLPNKASFYALYDLDKDGTITQAELGQSLVFNSSAGNPTGDINFYRQQMTQPGPQDLSQRGYMFFVQDNFERNRLSFNLGLRAEKYINYDTTGAKTFAFDYTWAPRLGVVYDLTGSGRQKLSGFWGRYYDPLRMDMTQFTGTATGVTFEEQLYANNQWVTYRVRGGPTVIDGFFAPTAKTPYTDELQFQHEIDLGNNISASTTYYYRRTRDIFEDFDPGLYTEPTAYPGSTTAPDTLFLGWEYFGWTAINHPAANFFLGTLEGGERNFQGLEFTGRKRLSNSWQGLASYSYLHAEGNAVSDGNADFAGDVLWLDPRAPNMYGTIPGTIHHLVKFGGTYTTSFGLEIGANWKWNSGVVVNKNGSELLTRRLPAQGDTSAFGGITSAKVISDVGGWVEKGAIGAVQNPSYGTTDVRVQYIRPFGNRFTAEFFVDMFNLFNNQNAIRLVDLATGVGTTPYLGEIQWIVPRRAFLGTRVRF